MARFGPPKIPKCLENGLFWDQKGVKNGPKMCFTKNDPGPFEVPKQVKRANFEPIASDFGPSKVTKCLKMGCFGTKNESKMDQNYVFPNILLDHLGCKNK